MSPLDEHAPMLETDFKEHTPRTVAEAQQAIQAQTGIRIKSKPSQTGWG